MGLKLSSFELKQNHQVENSNIVLFLEAGYYQNLEEFAILTCNINSL